MWFWELGVTLRRLVMTGAIVVLPRGSPLQYSVGLLVCVVGSLLQSSFRPYVGNSENVLSLMVELDTFVVIYAAFLSSLRDFVFEGTSGRNLGVLMVILTATVLVFGRLISY